jgi:hypothetical protein
VTDHGRGRRWIGVGTFLLAVAVAVWVVPRLGARSPVVFILLPILAILTMKLVERRVGQWFRRWAERQAGRTPRAGP